MSAAPSQSSSPSAGWERALSALEDDLRRRAVARNTAHAYRLDALQLARWATVAGIEPRELEVRGLRRYLAGLGE